ncbi:MAG TPA: SAM-dependent methyltransferase, partial [Xanthomonadaceae bacterium]|nr:SAM-dependent methyltransferase [Xanthomonadaceae bacterium]
MSLPLPEPDADALAHSARLADLIRAEITEADARAIPFSRFMELCLYAPGLGYYSAGAAKFGAAGDFVTAPELGGLFAGCVAEAVSPVLAQLGPQAGFLEVGGGSGAFAQQLLIDLAARATLPAQYRILEPSADLRERQQRRLREQLPDAVFERIAWLDGPPERPWNGVVFANEVIDALPTPRFAIDRGEVMEEHVAVDAEGLFGLVDRPADALLTAAVRHVENDLGAACADGYRSELLPQLPYWLQAVIGPMRRGALLLIDYGYPRRDYSLPERRDGTLLAHYRHRAHADVLRWPGLQDLSASVDFPALAEAGTLAGF